MGNLTDVDVFTDPIVSPDDGDDADEVTFEEGLQGLANRTRNHKNRLDAIDDDITALEDDVDDHETRIATMEVSVPSLIPNDGTYSVASVDNESNIAAVSPGDVSGFYTYIGFITGRTVTVDFEMLYTPNGSGLKVAELPVPTAVAVATENFDASNDAFGIGAAFLGNSAPGVPVQIFAVTGSKRVRLEWYDTETSGAGRKVRGRFTYRVKA